MRIFLIGLSEGFARSLARYVRGDPRLVLAGVAPSIALADIMLSAVPAALALVDWAALGASPRDSLRVLRQGRSGLRIICVVDDHAAYRAVALAAGADAVTSADRLGEELDVLLRGHPLPGARGQAPGGLHA
jgi:hypothetical protein